MMYDILTLQQYKSFAKINSDNFDDVLPTMISSVSKAIEKYCSKEFVTRQYIEYQDGDLTGKLLARRYPIYKITTIHDDIDHDFDSASLISSDDYRIEYDTGLVRLAEDESAFAKGEENIKIVYWAGYTRFLIIDEANNYIDINEGNGGQAIEIAAASTPDNTAYPGYSAEDLASTLEDALNDSDDLVYNYTVAYNHLTQKFTVSTGTAITIMWESGSSTDKNLADLMGYEKKDTKSQASHEAENAVTGIPADVRLAAGKMLQFYMDDTGHRRQLTRTKQTRLPQGAGDEAFLTDLPTDIKMLLESYRRILR